MNKWVRKIKTLRQLENKILVLIPKTVLLLGFSRFALLFFSFKRLIPLLGTLLKESIAIEKKKTEELKYIARTISIVSKNVPWESTCYVQALAGKIMLRQCQLKSTLYIGVKKNEMEKLEGHAWLKCGEYVVTGGIGHKQFKIIAFYT